MISLIIFEIEKLMKLLIAYFHVALKIKLEIELRSN